LIQLQFLELLDRGSLYIFWGLEVEFYGSAVP